MTALTTFSSAVALPFKVLRLFGVLQPSFDSKKEAFKVNNLQIFYTILITILFQGLFFNLWMSILRKLNNLYTVLDFFEKALWLTMNLFYSLPILYERTTHCFIFNSLNNLESRQDFDWVTANNILKQKCRRVIHFLALFFLVIYPISVYVCNVLILERFKSVSLIEMLGSYSAVFQFTFGNFYYILLCEKFRLNFRVLTNCVGKFSADYNLRQCLEIYHKLWKLSEMFAASMRVTLIGALIWANVLMSFQFYYNFVNPNLVGPTIVWQLLTGLIFVSCHFWGRVCGEVSSTVMKQEIDKMMFYLVSGTKNR